jgi:hypothetical protein
MVAKRGCGASDNEEQERDTRAEERNAERWGLGAKYGTLIFLNSPLAARSSSLTL